MSTRANVIITAKDATAAAFARVTRNLRLLQNSVTSLLGPLGAFKGMIGAIGLGILIRESVKAAEAIRGMDARIRRATEAMGDFNRTQRELYQISQRNGSALVETSNLFISLTRAASDLGRGRTQVLQLTDTVQQLGVISGASGEAMKNSLRQFSQAMAGGIVRAEEFNSIIENTPEIASRMAKGMGLTVGQLRLAVVEGRVLAEDVFNSLLGQSDEIRAEFEKMPLTIDRAWQALKNSMSRFIADANEASGATGGIAESIKGVADAIDDLNERVASGELAAEMKIWMETFEDFRRLAGEAVDWISIKISDGVIEWGEFFKDLPALMKIAFTEVFAWVDWGIAEINTIWQKLPLLWDKLWLNIRKKGREWWAQITNIFSSDDSLGSAMAEIQKEYSEAVGPINEDLKALDAAYEAAKRASLDTAAAIRKEQEARMENRRQLEQTARDVSDTIAAYEVYDAALEDHIQSQNRTRGSIVETNAAIKEQSVWSKAMSGAINDSTRAWSQFYGKLEGRYRASADTMLDLWDKLRNAVTGFGQDGKDSVDNVTDSLFDMQEAMKNVQNNLQDNLSTSLYDAFYGDKQKLREQKRALRDNLKDSLASIKKNELDKSITHAEAIDQRTEAEKRFQEDMDDLMDKGTKSWGDYVKAFAKDTLSTFVKLAADIAAAFATKKIFGWLNIDTGSINLGSILGAGKSNGTESPGTSPITIATIGKKVASWFGWGGGSTTSAVPGALGSVKGPAVLNYGTGAYGSSALGGQGAAAIGNGYGGGAVGGNVAAQGSAWGSAAGAAVVAAIAAYGFSRIGKKQQVRAERQAEFFTGVGTGTTENLGGSAWDFRGMLDDATAFFSTTREGWQSTVEALKEAGVAAQGWGASLDENGRGLVKIQGDIAGVKSALSSAVATGYDFVGSLSNAIEKGNNLRVSIQGDAEAIESALQAATAMGIGGFVGLEKTANGVSATLTGNIQLWDQYLQGFVNEAISSAVNGVSALGGAASDATKDFLTLANAAARVKVGSTIGGGRSAQVDGSHDRGLTYVPRDGYVAELHRGERVLTAEENRGLSRAGMDDTRMVKAIERQTQVIRRQGRRADYTIGGR